MFFMLISDYKCPLTSNVLPIEADNILPLDCMLEIQVATKGVLVFLDGSAKRAKHFSQVCVHDFIVPLSHTVTANDGVAYPASAPPVWQVH